MPSGFGILRPVGNQTFRVFWRPENLSFAMLLVTLSWLWAIVTMEYCLLRPGCKSFFFTRSYCEGGKQRHCVLDSNNELSLLLHYLQKERELSCSVCSDFLPDWSEKPLIWSGSNSSVKEYVLNAQLLPVSSSCSVRCQQGHLQYDQAPMHHKLCGNGTAFCVSHRNTSDLIPVTNSYWQKTAAIPQSWSNTCWIYAVQESNLFLNSVSFKWNYDTPTVNVLVWKEVMFTREAAVC